MEKTSHWGPGHENREEDDEKFLDATVRMEKYCQQQICHRDQHTPVAHSHTQTDHNNTNKKCILSYTL